MRAALLGRAARAGVSRLLAVSTDCASSRLTAALPEPVLKAVGVHPLHAGEGLCSELAELATRAGVVAIGETGFDAVGPDWTAQAASFRGQCGLARRLNLSVVLHIDGDGAWQALLREQQALAGLRVVRHYFRGDEAQLRWHAERGHFVSFGRPLLRAPALQALAVRYPAELLFIETDSYPLAGRTTEPQDVVAVGEALARLRGWSSAECRWRLWENGCRAFALLAAE